MTSKGYELLLAQLHENPEKAVEEFDRLRRKIIRYFIQQERGRWNADCEFLADDVIDRVAAHLEAGKPIEKNVQALAFSITRNVWLTFYNKNKQLVNLESVPEKSYQFEFDDESDDEKTACMKKCLVEVCKDDEERKNLLAYYDDSDKKLLEQRKSVAARLGTTTNNLKTRMSRLRDKLRACAKECFKTQQTV